MNQDGLPIQGDAGNRLVDRKIQYDHIFRTDWPSECDTNAAQRLHSSTKPAPERLRSIPNIQRLHESSTGSITIDSEHIQMTPWTHATARHCTKRSHMTTTSPILKTSTSSILNTIRIQEELEKSVTNECFIQPNESLMGTIDHTG